MLPRSHLTRLDFHLDVLSHSALLTSGGEAGAGGVKFHVGTDFQDRISHRGEGLNAQILSDSSQSHISLVSVKAV